MKLGVPEDQFDAGRSGLPTQLMITAVNTANTDILAFLSVVNSVDSRVCMLNGDGRRCSLFQIAQLLGLFALDDAYQILPMQFMPTSAPIAVLLANGKFSHSRVRTFAPWIEDEVNRLARDLLINHARYVRQVRSVLSFKRELGFEPLPRGFVFTDPMQSARLAPPLPQLHVDTAAAPLSRGVRWDHTVATDYQRDRYLSHLTRDQLASRLMDVMYNIHVVDAEDRITIDPADPASLYWLSRLQEIQVEMVIRYGPDAMRKEKLLAGQEWPLSLQRQKWRFSGALASPESLTRPYLIKYGDSQFLQRLVDHGELLLSPASRYADPSLNAAIRDDERTARIEPLPPGFTGGGLLARRSENVSSAVAVTKRINTDYLVYCTSTNLETRLAHDFGANAAVVIHDPQTFLDRLDSAVRRHIPDARQIVAEVKYYDPYNVSDLQVDVLTWKHFRFAYQYETRFAWLPSKRTDRLEQMLISAGPLADICSLVIPPAMAAIKSGNRVANF
jgi:hypothetical protein